MAKLIPIVIDYETYWTATHSLTKMNPMAYVMHPDTEIISVAIKEDTQPTYCVFGEDNVRYAMRQIDWSDKLMIAHNNEGFDSMISAWRLGIKPAMWGCTLAMARPHFAKTVGLSLAKLVEHFGLGVKDNSALRQTRGKHLKDFTPDEIRAMSAYNVADTNQGHALFYKLLAMTSKEEMRIIDATIRMLVEPKFVLDTELLRDTLVKEQARKTDVVMKLAGFLGIDGLNAQEEVTTTLASAPKFSALLESLGAETPMKQSPTAPDKLIPALAKTDQGMLDLLESDNEIVAAAAEARLGVKSTLLESRIDAFMLAAEACSGRLPMPTKYCGADTTWRRSGWAFNPLNLPRVSGKLSDALRNSMRAPPGYKVVVADLSGIELRVNHFLWQEPSSMALFRADPEKADLYKDFASALYGVPVSEVTKAQRQVGKVAHLGLGYGAGWKAFQKVAKTLGGVVLTEDEAKDIVNLWRAKYAKIVEGWKTFHASLPSIRAAVEDTLDPWGLCRTGDDMLILPKTKILYPALRQETDVDSGKKEWKYGDLRHTARIYAGKGVENMTQALARTIINDHMLEIRRRSGQLPALEVYDELVYVVPEQDAEAHLDLVLGVMRISPTWWPELVLWAEGDIADTYGAAK